VGCGRAALVRTDAEENQLFGLLRRCAFSHRNDWPLVVVFATLALFVSPAIALVTGLPVPLAFLIACGLVFGIQIVLVQIAERYKSNVAEKLMGWYAGTCAWAWTALLVAGAVLLVWSLFRAEPDSGTVH